MTRDNEGNLVDVLRLFAAWRPCSACGLRVLFVDEQARTDSAFLCGRCERRREDFGRQCRGTFPTRPAPKVTLPIPPRRPRPTACEARL